MSNFQINVFEKFTYVTFSSIHRHRIQFVSVPLAVYLTPCYGVGVVDLRRPSRQLCCQILPVSIMNVMSRNLIDWGRQGSFMVGGQSPYLVRDRLREPHEENKHIAPYFFAIGRGDFCIRKWVVWLKGGNG